DDGSGSGADGATVASISDTEAFTFPPDECGARALPLRGARAFSVGGPGAFPVGDRSVGGRPFADAAQRTATCVQKNAQQANLEHCGHEVLFKGGIGTPPERIIEAWFNSPGHRKALTYPGSRNAGPAIVTNAEGTAIFAAINIDT
ncbi:CAP domain-containing protein, partial [Streptomyces sp. NRRL F-2664]|uniref:CAP domain-containing protein n=1 Tax=Streptomyces sp. NRRL F-2664 TaxID=1463842 RepID=UPI0004CBA6E4